MTLIFSFLFSLLLISPALAQSAAGETGGVVVLLIICGVIFLALRKRRRRQGEERDRAQLIRDRPPVVVRTYRGNQQRATALFQRDAADMASLGYVPKTQIWAQGTWGMGNFILALLLCLILIGIIVFIYMLLVRPAGTLTVTCERQAVAEVAEEKTCPQCAERVKADALVCRFCGYKFAPEEVRPPARRA